MPTKADSVIYPTPGHAFVAQDRILDRRATGPRWLLDPRVADLVADSILIGESERQFYQIGGWVVMPNHVHLLILPLVRIPVLMRWLKGSTARKANQVLGRSGHPFWQDESWDHYLRRSTEYERIKAYIGHNPVSAGLAISAESWRWSSAGRQAEPPAPPTPTHLCGITVACSGRRFFLPRFWRIPRLPEANIQPPRTPPESVPVKV